MKKLLLFDSLKSRDSTILIGQKKRVKADGKLICLVRTKASIIAFYDQCPHLGASLSTGHLNTINEVICPWHAYRFNLKTGEESERRCSELQFLEVIEEDDKTFLII